MSFPPPVLWLSTNAVQPTVPIGDDCHPMSSPPPVLWLSTNAVQPTVPIGDDYPCPPPVLWLSTNAVQPTLPIGDDCHLMFFTPPVLWPITTAVQPTVPIRDDCHPMSFPPPILWLSTNGVFRSSFPLFSISRYFWTVGFPKTKVICLGVFFLLFCLFLGQSVQEQLLNSDKENPLF